MSFVSLVSQNNVSVLEDVHRLISQPMYNAKLLINESQMEENAAAFLSTYNKNCQQKTPVSTNTAAGVLCPCVPDGLGELLRATNRSLH